jgi:16S rRNA processing protein RimM
MRKEDCFFLGTVVAKYSFKGEVLIKLDTDDPETYLSLQFFLLEDESHLIPYFTTKVQLHKSQLLRVFVEGVKSEKQADLMIGKSVYLPLDQLPKLADDQFYFHEIIGFKVIDSVQGPIGTITGVNDASSQVLLEVEHNDRQILIPLVDELIQQLDKQQKQLYLSIPEGLLDLNS